MIKYIIWTFLLPIFLFSQNFNDEDLDGVPDNLDKCPHTPFLSEVDKNGCIVKILTLPKEAIYNSLIFSYTIGINHDKELQNNVKQTIHTIALKFYQHDWSFIIQTGYFKEHSQEGLTDTIIKLKKHFFLSPKLRMAVGGGVKLPTDNFKGNKTDFTLYSSFSYYPSKKFSIFAGYSYTFIRDKKVTINLTNSSNAYIGTGYFLTNYLYTDLSIERYKSKFSNEKADYYINGSIYYKINKKLFTTFSYTIDVDHTNNNSISLTIGYKFW